MVHLRFYCIVGLVAMYVTDLAAAGPRGRSASVGAETPEARADMLDEKARRYARQRIAASPRLAYARQLQASD